MQEQWNLSELADLGALRVRGPDTVTFLQGQVSNDVARLTPQQSLLAGYHNPQGRTIAVLRLVQLGQDDLLAILPRELAATVASRLSKFILRAKVKIVDESASWRVAGLVAPEAGSGGNPGEPVGSSLAAAQFDAATSIAHFEGDSATIALESASAVMLPDTVGGQSQFDSSTVVRVGASPPRWLVISPADQTSPLPAVARAERDAWRLLDIAAGQPQIYAATSEEFVAQMLNLDALGAIAFDKGCYTGQEVIARAHYRGRVKRRLQGFVSRGALSLAAGDSGQLADGRAFKVVEAVQLADGRCEFLAVAPLAAGDQEPAAASNAAPAQGAHADAEQLGLPYALPD
ncbi:MAG: folate-binding protein [Gammaproteobacteria bacterium]|nr:folate-binding protein [Gammaproteobacteria bacterium]